MAGHSHETKPHVDPKEAAKKAVAEKLHATKPTAISSPESIAAKKKLLSEKFNALGIEEFKKIEGFEDLTADEIDGLQEAEIDYLIKAAENGFKFEEEESPEEKGVEAIEQIIENEDLPKEVRQEIKKHESEVWAVLKPRLRDIGTFLRGVAPGMVAKTTASYIFRRLGKSALDVSAPGLGAAVGALVGGGWEFQKFFREEGRLAKSAAGAEARLKKIEELSPIDQIKLYIATHSALENKVYKGDEKDFESLNKALELVDIKTIVRKVEWEKQPEVMKKLEALADIRNAEQKEILMQDSANKEIIKKLEKEQGKGKRNKKRIALATLKGAAIGALGGALGGWLGEKIPGWLGWKGEGTGETVQNTAEAAKKGAGAVTKEIAKTKVDLVEKMHKHVWGTVKQWYLDHGVPKDKVTNKLINEGVKKITENNPADLPGVPTEELKNRIHVKAWKVAKDMAYKYLDTKMQEGTDLHHMERLIDVAKDQGINITDPAIEKAAETAANAATDAAAQQTSETAGQTIGQILGEGGTSVGKQITTSDAGYQKFMYGVAIGAPVVVIGGLGIAKWRRGRKAKQESAATNTELENPDLELNSNDDTENGDDDLDDDNTPPPKTSGGGGTGPKNPTDPKEEPKQPEKKKGMLKKLGSILATPAGDLVKKGKEKIEELQHETTEKNKLVAKLEELENPLKTIFGKDFVIQYAKGTPASEYTKPEAMHNLEELGKFLSIHGGLLTEAGISGVAVTLNENDETRVEKDKNGNYRLRVNLKGDFHSIIANIANAEEQFKREHPKEDIEKEKLVAEARKLGFEDDENINRWVNLMDPKAKGLMRFVYGPDMEKTQDLIRTQTNWKKIKKEDPIVGVFEDLINAYNQSSEPQVLGLIQELSQLAPEAKKLALNSIPEDDSTNYLKQESFVKTLGALNKASAEGILDKRQVDKILKLKSEGLKDNEDLASSFMAVYEGLAKNPDRTSLLQTLIDELRKLDNKKHEIESGVRRTRLSTAAADAYDKFKDEQRTGFLRRRRGN